MAGKALGDVIFKSYYSDVVFRLTVFYRFIDGFMLRQHILCLLQSRSVFG